MSNVIPIRCPGVADMEKAIPADRATDGNNVAPAVSLGCFRDDELPGLIKPMTMADVLRRVLAYHEKIDDVRQVGLGPEHDWSSHGADAFGLGCVAYEIPLVEEEDDGREIAARGRNAWTGY